MYVVGEKVKIKENLIPNKDYGNRFFHQKMKKYCGKVVTIKMILSIEDRVYAIEEDGDTWGWTEEMLENIPNIDFLYSKKQFLNYKIGDKVKIKKDIITIQNNIVTINKVINTCNGPLYLIKEDNNSNIWDETMFDE